MGLMGSGVQGYMSSMVKGIGVNFQGKVCLCAPGSVRS